MNNQFNSLIDQFINSYQREYDYHQEAARLCHNRCEMLLGKRGIRAMITHRAKNPVKLRDKLEQRNKSKSYASVEEMRTDIVDLAGIRIALYFPGDRGRVGQLIRENFDVRASKSFPDDSKKDGNKRFNGYYYADHFRVQMTEQSLAQEQKRFSEAAIEIQLGSVLMHAWAEVEHDLIYKPENGTLSEDEYAILDELNGLVLSGEIALERLQRALERRLSAETAVLDNHYDLAAFLHNSLMQFAPAAMPAMGRVDALWEILHEAGKNNVAALKPILDSIRQLDRNDTISDQIADAILEEHPELYPKYVELQSQYSDTTSYAANKAEVDESRAALGEFLSRWIIVERTFGDLAIHLGVGAGSARLISSSRSMDQLAFQIGMSKEHVARLRRLRSMRNQLVHGIEFPSKPMLNQAIGEFDDLFAIFEHSQNPEVRDAYALARTSIPKE